MEAAAFAANAPIEVRFVPPDVLERLRSDTARFANRELPAELVRRAAGHDVILVHENEKRIYGDIPERCKDIVESIGSPMLRLVWDPANFVQCGVRPFTRGYQQLRSYVEYLHIKDAMMATGAVVPAGAGDGELVPTIRALRADGFDGFLSLEPHLALGEDFGGFSGPKLFGTAHGAFATMLDNENIEYR